MIRMHLVIEVSAGTGETITIDVTKNGGGDNPRYYPSVARRILLELAARIDEALVAHFGDIGTQASSAYLRPLPTAKEWTT